MKSPSIIHERGRLFLLGDIMKKDMEQTNWVVITGGPSSGKSTVLEYLKDKGYATTAEMARVYIDEQIAQGKTLAEVRGDEENLQRTVLQMKIDLEERTPLEQLTFFDRGIPDTIAYQKIFGGDIAAVLRASRKRRYKSIFLFEPIPFIQDYARTEDQEQADEIRDFYMKRM